MDDQNYLENYNFDYSNEELQLLGNNGHQNRNNNGNEHPIQSIFLNGTISLGDTTPEQSSHSATSSSNAAPDSESDMDNESPPSPEPSPPPVLDYTTRNAGQSQMAEAVIDAIINQKNLLIESPPRMERKLTILKAVLSYWQWRYNNLENDLLDQMGMDRDKCPKPAKIIFGTRNFLETQKLLKEIKSELGTTQLLWKMAMAVLDHRGNLCINTEVTSGLEDIDLACQKLICQQQGINLNLPSTSKKARNQESTSACEYYRPSDDADGALPLVRESFGVAGPQQEISDIEDLMLLGHQTSRCPYHDRLYQVNNANLLILPIEFLLDSSLREQYGIHLNEDIIICDDGSDLEEYCRKSATIDMSLDDLIASSSLLQSINNHLNNQPSQNETGISHLEDYLQTLSTYIRDNATRCPDKNDILMIINQLDISMVNIPLMLSEIMDYVQSSAHVIPESEGIVVNKLRKFITILPLLIENNSSFSVKLTSVESPSNRNLFQKFLQVNCANPSVVLKPVENATMPLIVGSHSIAPYSPFKSEFPDIQFEEPLKILQNDPFLFDRLLVTYTGKGATGVKFTLNYNSRNHPHVKREIGLSLLKIFEVIPNGKIVLFHSDEYFGKLLECWRNTRVQPDEEETIMDALLGSATAVICELDMKTDEDTERLMRDYQAAALTPGGAVLLLLHRGKVYKNWDLNYSETVPRAIIHVGLPFGSWKMDADIISKRQYLDEMYEGYETKENLDWYIKESFRILNQSFSYAIAEEGRRNDCWGIVIVLHDRMRGESHEFDQKLPTWVARPRYHRDLSHLIQHVQTKIGEWTGNDNI